MKAISLRIPITPTPKGRPRVSILGGHAHAYTPKKTADYERDIAYHYTRACGGFMYDRDQALTVRIEFGMPIPKSTPKSRKDAIIEGIIKHIKKPDVDNLVKAVLDALNGVAWVDDSQIVRLIAEKRYSTEPYVFINVTERVE